MPTVSGVLIQNRCWSFGVKPVKPMQMMDTEPAQSGPVFEPQRTEARVTTQVQTEADVPP
jgi:hypothetical protein